MAKKKPSQPVSFLTQQLIDAFARKLNGYDQFVVTNDTEFRLSLQSKLLAGGNPVFVDFNDEEIGIIIDNVQDSLVHLRDSHEEAWKLILIVLSDNQIDYDLSNESLYLTYNTTSETPVATAMKVLNKLAIIISATTDYLQQIDHSFESFRRKL